MALSAQDIQKVYLADLGRPADPAGLTHWQAQEDLPQVADGFARSDEYKSLHASQDTAQLVTSIYHNLFGHAPDSAVLADWLKEIESGQTEVDRLGLAIADSAQGTDAEVLQAKLDAAQDFTGYLSAVAKMVGSAPMDLAAVRDAWAEIKSPADFPGDFSALIQNHVSLSDLVQKVYVAYFGRPADPAGLDYWVTKAVDTNGDWAGIAAAFYFSAEAKALYDTSTDTAFITAVYQNLYGRAPEEGGLKYWTDQLTEGKVTREMLPLAIANGAQGSDMTTEQQRLTAADEFIQELQTTNHTADYDGSTTTAAAREWLYGIGPDKADLDAAKSSLSTLVSSFDHGKVQGKAVDSYIKDATVYIDSNDNGKLDTGEVSVTTDAGGKFVLPANAPKGTLIVEGGTNTATGQANTAVLKAPVGSLIASPITTLVQQMVASGVADSVENAHDQLFASLGIPQVAFSAFDPIQQALSGDSTTKAAAVALEAKTVQVANVLTVAEAALRGAGVSAVDAQTAVLQALANNIAKGTTDLTNTDTVQAVLQAAVTAAPVPADKQAALTQASAYVAKVIAASNDLTEKAAAAFAEGTVTDPAAALSDVFRVATLVQTDIAPKVQEAAPTGNVQQVVDDYTGDNLITNLAGVMLDEIAPGVPAPPEGGILPPPTPTPDTTPPAATLAITAIVDDTGTPGDFITSDTTLTVRGTATGLGTGEKAQISTDGTTWTDLTVGADDRWSYNDSTTHSDGTVTYRVRAIDAAGNATTSVSQGVKIDTTPEPEPPYVPPTPPPGDGGGGGGPAPDTTPPVFQSAATSADGTKVILTYDEALDATNKAATTDFAVVSGGNANAVTAATVSGSMVELTLTTSVANGDTVTVSYTDPTASNDTNAIQDAAGNDAASITDRWVTNTMAPEFSWASTSEDGTSIILDYDEPLDGTNLPPADAFTVKINGTAVSLADTSPVSVSGNTVTLKLATAVTSTDTVTVSYTDPTASNDTNAIQDATGNDAVTLATATVTNNVLPDTTAPLISAGTFTEAENSTITLSFNENMQVLDTTGLTVQTSGGGESIVSTITVDDDNPTNIKITTSATLYAPDYVKLSYDSDTGTITDTAGNKAGSMFFYIGGSGDNMITADTLESNVRIEGNDGNDTLTGSDNQDIIIGHTGVDTLAGGKSMDVFVFVAGYSGKPTETNFDVITDWNTEDTPDRLVFPNLSIVQNGTASSGTAAIDSEGFATFAGDDNTLDKCITAVAAGINAGGDAASGQFAVFEVSGNSYVFISDGTDDVTNNDVLIQLTGITGLNTSDLVGGMLSLT